MENAPPGLSIFFPAYNDGGTIASMVLSAILVAEELTTDYEIIVIDDGSSDFTPQILDRLAADYPRVRVIHHQGNKGYGGALRSGFDAATKELIFYTDGDAQYDVRDLRVLYPLMTPETDIAQGWKISRADPWYRKVIGRIYHHVVSIMFGLKIRDVDCDFRLIRRRVFDKVTLTRSSGVICVEMIKKMTDHGFVFAQGGVGHYHRAYGKSQFFNFARIWRVGIDLIQLWRELVLRREHLTAPGATAHSPKV